MDDEKIPFLMDDEKIPFLMDDEKIGAVANAPLK